MRAFVAAVPPPQVREDLDEFLAPRRAVDGPRWSLPEHTHLTLAFLPELAEDDLDEVADRLQEGVGRRRPFDLRIAGAGAFPDVAAAKVLWAGVRDADADGGLLELERLAVGARNAASVAGATVAGGPFRPHVTLARFGRGVDATRWVRVLDTYAGPTWHVDRVALVRSRLGQGRGGRPRHDVLEEFRLGMDRPGHRALFSR